MNKKQMRLDIYCFIKKLINELDNKTYEKLTPYIWFHFGDYLSEDEMMELSALKGSDVNE